MRYSLRQLEVFVATAHHQNLTRAAQSLAMSQSAASGALKELESQFEIQLFDRVGKRLQLNELGRLLRPQAEALLERARELESSLLRHADIGPLRVGATLSIGNYLAVDILARFMELHPQAQATLEVANTREISRQILNFDLDVALIEGELQHPELEIQPWREDELVVVCAPDHPLAGRPALTDGELTAAHWLLREPGSGTRQAFDRAMRGLLPRLDIRLQLQHTEAIKHGVETGLGIACLSRICVEEEIRRGRLVPLPVPHRDFHRQFYLVHHRHKYRSAGVLHWLALCRQEYGPRV